MSSEKKIDDIVRLFGERKDFPLKMIRMRMAHKHKERLAPVDFGEFSPVIVEEQIHLFQFHVKPGMSDKTDFHFCRHSTFSDKPRCNSKASIT